MKDDVTERGCERRTYDLLNESQSWGCECICVWGVGCGEVLLHEEELLDQRLSARRTCTTGHCGFKTDSLLVREEFAEEYVCAVSDSSLV